MKLSVSSLDVAIVQCLVLVALQMNAISKSLTSNLNIVQYFQFLTLTLHRCIPQRDLGLWSCGEKVSIWYGQRMNPFSSEILWLYRNTQYSVLKTRNISIGWDRMKEATGAVNFAEYYSAKFTEAVYK